MLGGSEEGNGGGMNKFTYNAVTQKYKEVSKILRHESRSPGQNSQAETSEYKAGVPTPSLQIPSYS
jgi:hypothetical protein